MKSCVSIHNKTFNKENTNINDIKKEITEMKKRLEELEKMVEKTDIKNKTKQIFFKKDIIKMSNKEIQELFNNHICYIEYLKSNGEFRIFDGFTFKKEHRIPGSGNFDYEKEVQNFVFGIETDTNEYKRLKAKNIQYIEIID